MEIINAIPLVGPFLAVVIPFLLVLSIVVAVHELGHLLVGRWCGIKAEVYSIGFGKVIWSRTDRHGTVWQVAALPLGGFVKFLGDMDPASAGKADDNDIPAHDRHRAFHNASLRSRTLTVLAGPVANFLLSILIFAAIGFSVGKPSEEPIVGAVAEGYEDEIGLMPGDRILAIDGVSMQTYDQAHLALRKTGGAPTPVRIERDGERMEVTSRYTWRSLVTGLDASGGAANVGILPGDLIVELDGKPVSSARDVQLIGIELTPGDTVPIVVEREDQRIEFDFQPTSRYREHPITGEQGHWPMIGIRLGDFRIAPELVFARPDEALLYGVQRVWQIITDTIEFVNQIIFRGADTSNLSGPIGIAKFSGEAAERGATSLLHFVAFLSTAIGLFNLFPIPVLDGGHLMFYIAEALRGRPVGEAWMRMGTMVGLSVVLLLMVFVTYNDFMKL